MKLDHTVTGTYRLLVEHVADLSMLWQTLDALDKPAIVVLADGLMVPTARALGRFERRQEGHAGSAHRQTEGVTEPLFLPGERRTEPLCACQPAFRGMAWPAGAGTDGLVAPTVLLVLVLVSAVLGWLLQFGSR